MKRVLFFGVTLLLAVALLSCNKDDSTGTKSGDIYIVEYLDSYLTHELLYGAYVSYPGFSEEDWSCPQEGGELELTYVHTSTLMKEGYDPTDMDQDRFILLVDGVDQGIGTDAQSAQVSVEKFSTFSYRTLSGVGIYIDYPAGVRGPNTLPYARYVRYNDGSEGSVPDSVLYSVFPTSGEAYEFLIENNHYRQDYFTSIEGDWFEITSNYMDKYVLFDVETSMEFDPDRAYSNLCVEPLPYSTEYSSVYFAGSGTYARYDWATYGEMDWDTWTAVNPFQEVMTIKIEPNTTGAPRTLSLGFVGLGSGNTYYTITQE